MAKIINVIEKQNFEIIRDRIGAILYTEIKNQLQLTNNDILKCDIFVERNTPVDKIEVPTIIVSLASINFDNKNQTTVRGTTDYYIDVYTSAISGSTADGGQRASLNLHRIAGICRYILEHPAYKTLDFTPGMISNVAVKSLNIRSLQGNDAMNTAMGRLVLSVAATETNGHQCACDLSDYYTNVKIDTSNQGYVYITEKTT